MVLIYGHGTNIPEVLDIRVRLQYLANHFNFACEIEVIQIFIYKYICL
jgi:hypothetical protein